MPDVPTSGRFVRDAPNTDLATATDAIGRQRVYWRLEGDFSWRLWHARQLFINIFNGRAVVVGNRGKRPRN